MRRFAGSARLRRSSTRPRRDYANSSGIKGARVHCSLYASHCLRTDVNEQPSCSRIHIAISLPPDWRLTVPPGAGPAKARPLLEQAERGCLITDSLRGTRELSSEIIVADA